MAGRIKNLNGNGPLASVSLTAQAASIGSTTLLNAPALSGVYRITGYLVASTGSGGSTVLVSFAYTDSVQAQTTSPQIASPTFGSTLSLATTGNNGWFTFEFYAMAGNAINYSTTLVGTGQYNIYLRLESA